MAFFRKCLTGFTQVIQFPFAAVALISSSSLTVARAECPSLAGNYDCPQFGVVLNIEQKTVESHTVYTILNTGEQIRTDGNLHPYFAASNSRYRASCKHGELTYDIYSYVLSGELSEITHEHQTWGAAAKRLSIESVIVRSLGQMGVEEMPRISCTKK